ncbi:SpoIIE family protein phosphatase [Yersinia nurmii]|uniref:Chemotaxis regulatory protein CheY n=1 Tax=Yersinia nurmii TaxID=685706 RepID=A0AAW7JU20_9GAMM|nr:SpoIIE family protein phosphatase [Yersinia nurmii]MDN0086104.1 SpoIIE family protein phosphatase [Yersinia nurmii]CND84893.1 chemotaxis regulatory protein CheY [Yersinia nurmii]
MQPHPSATGVTSILVVDDSASYRFLLVNLLKNWKFTVFEAENGQDALAILESHSINMVISDWEMPVMDGVKLCTTIRKHYTDRYIYLVLITVRQSIEDLIAGLDAGADDFLSKPINQSELRARLHAGERILMLEATLDARNQKLSQAYEQIENDLQAAAKLQRSILPAEKLMVNGFQAEWMFIPSAYVSGDLLSFFQLGNQHIGFYSIDVAGHGVAAAMLSLSVARQFLNGRTVDNLLISLADTPAGYLITPPHKVVNELNRRFCIENDDISTYFTLIYGVIDVQTAAGVLCQAGHPTPFIVSSSSQITPVGEGGPPVGLIDSMDYQDTAFTLASGDRLYLFTDGIIECENAEQELFGERRLQELLAASQHDNVQTVFRQVQQSLKCWHPVQKNEHQSDIQNGRSAFSDDISLLVIERNDNSLLLTEL